MKKGKINFQDLKVTSFTTSANEMISIRGGGTFPVGCCLQQETCECTQYLGCDTQYC